jgi:hypothetical protein
MSTPPPDDVQYLDLADYAGAALDEHPNGVRRRRPRPGRVGPARTGGNLRRGRGLDQAADPLNCWPLASPARPDNLRFTVTADQQVLAPAQRMNPAIS